MNRTILPHFNRFRLCRLFFFFAEPGLIQALPLFFVAFRGVSVTLGRVAARLFHPSAGACRMSAEFSSFTGYFDPFGSVSRAPGVLAPADVRVDPLPTLPGLQSSWTLPRVIYVLGVPSPGIR